MLQAKSSSPPPNLANLLQICIDQGAHRAGKLIQAHILRTDLSSNTFLVNRLIELHSKCSCTAYARRLFDQMPVRNIFSYHAALDSYCRSNDVREAYRVFDRMPERNAVSWNLLIGMLSRIGHKDEAVESYYTMRSYGFIPTHVTLSSVLSACGGMRKLDCGKECHGVAIKLGLDEISYVGNAVLGMYAKCGCIEDVLAVHKTLPELNHVSFTSLMEGLSEVGRVEEAFHMFNSIHESRSVDYVSMSSVLGVCSKLEKSEETKCWQGKQIHGLAVKLGFERHLQVNNSLLDMYAKQGCMNDAEALFNSLSEVSVVSWNIMIGGHGNEYNKDKAVEFLGKMQSSGFEPDEITYFNMLSACLKVGDFENGIRVFDSMPSPPSLNSWNAVLSGYSQKDHHLEAVNLFREMNSSETKPDRTTFAIALASCSSLELLREGKQVHAALLKTSFCSDLHAASGLISVYSKCGEMGMAKDVFRKLSHVDVVCLNSMLAGFSVNGLDTEAFTLFQEALRKGMKPTEFTCATILACCCSSLSPLGKQVHALVAKNGHASDVYVGTALINLYSNCGEVEKARLIFETMQWRNTVTCNEMIHGFAKNGRGEDAVVLFEEMIRSGRHPPDSITLIAVLTACSHSGLVDWGLKIFKSMVQPQMDHYTCVVDMMGRLGWLGEMEDLVEMMGGAVAWEVVLSACRVHGNVKLAKRAAGELMRLDPNNSASYSLLVGTHSSLDQWDDVGTAVMVDVSKRPGYSCLL
ncbi:hypothetical protein M569_01433 [Genlisea aurea]|uniref:Pentatricopeptide repeat-containing protein n=1 Tax=Genlisea aurea TaxID=192259 RepID=S8EL36_9LAMI|nr:hypothetical protein M569_01433 [Genlisea aurea]